MGPRWSPYKTLCLLRARLPEAICKYNIYTTYPYLTLHIADITDEPEQAQHAQANPEADIEDEPQVLGILVEVVDQVSGCGL